MTQTARPISDTDRGLWVGDGDETTNLWDRLNDETDTEYIKDEANNTTGEFAIGGLVDPVGNTLHVLTVRMQGNGSGGPERVMIQLFEGATQRATSLNFTSRAGWTTQTYTLTAGEADSITDYTAGNLSIKLISSNLAGGETMWASWAKFEVPDAPAGGSPWYNYAQE